MLSYRVHIGLCNRMRRPDDIDIEYAILLFIMLAPLAYFAVWTLLAFWNA